MLQNPEDFWKDAPLLVEKLLHCNDRDLETFIKYAIELHCRPSYAINVCQLVLVSELILRLKATNEAVYVKGKTARLTIQSDEAAIILWPKNELCWGDRMEPTGWGDVNYPDLTGFCLRDLARNKSELGRKFQEEILFSDVVFRGACITFGGTLCEWWWAV